MAWGIPKLGTLVETTLTAWNLVEPAGVAQGDLMIACIAYRGNQAITRPFGWEVVATVQNDGDTDATNGIASGMMIYTVRGASAPSLICDRGTGSDVILSRVISYSGGALAPYDTGSANTLAVASATVTTGTITTARSNELIVAMVSGGDAYTTSAFDAATDPTTASGATDTTTAPTAGTWKERHDSSTATGSDCTLAIADAIRATAGATGTIQATLSGAARSVMIAGAFKIYNASPTVALNTPADASSVSSLPILDFTGTDAEGEDVRYNVQVDIQNTFDSQVSSLAVVDSYSEVNDGGSFFLLFEFHTYLSYAQSFAVDNEAYLNNCKFYLKKVGGPTGNAVAKLYAHAGTFGISSVPTGTALATSDNFDISTLSTSYQLITFPFTGTEQYLLAAGTKYALALQCNSGNSTNCLHLCGDYSAPSHQGNMAQQNSSSLLWASDNIVDLIFYVYAIPKRPLIEAVSGTDAGFVNPDNGADTDPFTSGENIQYTVQSADALGPRTYYWRVRGIDPSGSGLYGAWSATRSVAPDEILPLQTLAIDTTTDAFVELGITPPALYDVSSEVLEVSSTIVKTTISSSTAEGEVPQQQAVIESYGGGESGNTKIAPGNRVDARVEVTGAGADVGLGGGESTE